MAIVDNQAQGTMHIRYASGKGGKTPTEYFLRAPEASSMRAFAEENGERDVDDDNTNLLPEPYMDDGTARMDFE